MSKCADRDIQEMLPDLLHRALRSGARERVELHVATCESCREDLAVLRAVKGAAVFAPAIDVGRMLLGWQVVAGIAALALWALARRR